MNKKLIIVIGLIVLLSFSAGAVMLFGSTRNGKEQVQTKPEVRQLVDEQVISLVPSYDGTAIWYFSSNGRLFRVSTDGSGLSEFPLPALRNGTLESISWPPSGNDFMAITSQAGNKIKNFYDNQSKIYKALPPNIQSFDWLPDGKRIAYIWKSGDNITQQLAVADADGSGYKAVKDVFWPDLMVKISPLGKEALLIRSKIEGDVNKIYRINLESGFIETVIGQGKNLDAMWLPDGERFIFAQDHVTAVPELYLYDLTRKRAVDLGIKTPLDKIVIDKDSKYLYAAVQKQDNSGDAFLKIDLETFKIEPYFDPNKDVRAKSLVLIGNTVYFIDTRDGKIYYIK